MVEAKHGQVVVFTSATGARPDPITSIYGGTRAGANGDRSAPSGSNTPATGSRSTPSARTTWTFPAS